MIATWLQQTGRIVSIRQILSSDDFQPARCKIAVWGLGYIGLTTLQALLREGFSVIGVESSPDRIAQITSGSLTLNTETNMVVDVRAYLDAEKLTLISSSDAHLGIDAACHFVCVPTERDGVPDDTIVISIVEAIGRKSPTALVIVESTLAPNWLFRAPLNDRNVIVAPRRDWFHSASHTLKSLTRVVGTSDAEIQGLVAVVLEKISDSVVYSHDKVAVSTAKAFENSLWYILFSYVGELATRQSDFDLQEVLRLVQTNWRTPFEFAPSFHVGGYCLPLSYPYMASLVGSEAVSLLAEASAANKRTLDATVKKILAAPDIETVLILGLTYRPGIRVTTNSAGSMLGRELSRAGVTVLAHDPLLQSEDVLRLGARYVDALVGINDSDCIVICTDHKIYRGLKIDRYTSMPKLRYVFDCCGSMERYADFFGSRNIIYRRIGTRNW